ncbi:MAG: hypothetical protein HY887_01290 [Deltaproteobacteria bacterium]|nr:hypothetical protein [Deltaproteobacteria bacterium]
MKVKSPSVPPPQTRGHRPLLQRGRIALTGILAAAFFLASLASAADYKPCGVRLDSLSVAKGVPGQVFEMQGSWGSAQGEKLPAINKGNMNRLEVIGWGESELKVRVPKGLGKGVYKVGVYCNDLSKGGSYSSGWMDFEVTGVQEANAGAARLAAPAESKAVLSEKPALEAVNPIPRQEPQAQRPVLPRAGTGEKPKDKAYKEGVYIGVGAAVFFIFVLLLILKMRSVSTVKMPDAGPVPMARPDEFNGAYNGVEYVVACYGVKPGKDGEFKDGEPIVTVEIYTQGELKKPLEVNARKFFSVIADINDNRAKDIQAIISLGADYIDIGFNTSRVAAEVPLGRARVDKTLAEKIVSHLIRLRELSA